MTKTITSNQINKTAKENFSHVWKLYYEMQIPMLLNFKKIHGNLESFHVWGICVVNQALNSKRNDNSKMDKEDFLEKYIFSSDDTGINAMSISDITGIPRATVIRKLNKLVKNNFLKITHKKHYLTSSSHRYELKNVQKINFMNLSKFATRLFNLCLSE
jgi:hypothetical protein